MSRLACALTALLLMTPASLTAESKNPADYPLRVQIIGKNETNFYSMRSVDQSKGEGRGNLFANGDVHAVDFSYECSDKLKATIAFETYPAKWKKPNQELTVLMPVFGKSNAYWTCTLKTNVKDVAYLVLRGRVTSEPSADYKAWMVKHDFDPEHGKNGPTRPVDAPAAKGDQSPSAN